MKKRVFKALSLALVAIMIVASISIPAFAAELLDKEQTVSITLNCDKSGYTFEVFEVAQLKTASTTTFKTSYEPLVAEIANEIKEADSKELLNKLDNLSTLTGAVSHGTFVSSDKTKTFADLEQGVYYIKCIAYPAGVKSVENSVVALPYYDNSNGWVYSIDPINLATKVADDVPTTDKVITNSTKDNESFTDVSIGDVVDFKLTNITAGSTSFKLIKYTVYDKMSKGLTLDLSSVKAYLADKDGNKVADLTKSDYAVNVTSQAEGKDTEFNVALNAAYLAKNDFYESNVNSMIVTYSAVVNEYAEKGADGNPNTDVELEYGNTSIIDKVPGNTVYVYTYGASVTKLDENSEALSGATFEIYLTEADAKQGKNSLGTGTSDDNGQVKFIKNDVEISLASGSYFIAEIEAPKDYNLYGDIIPIEIKVEYNDVFSNGTWVKSSPADGYATVTVTDTKLVVPQTGGYVWVLYVIGAVSVAVGLAIFFVAKKKKSTAVSQEIKK